MREDAALAAQNLMLMATALGLGSCWIGFAQGWLNTAEGHQILNIPAKALVVAPIIAGQPRTVPPPVERKTPLVSWIGHRHIGGEKSSKSLSFSLRALTVLCFIDRDLDWLFHNPPDDREQDAETGNQITCHRLAPPASRQAARGSRPAEPADAARPGLMTR